MIAASLNVKAPIGYHMFLSAPGSSKLFAFQGKSVFVFVTNAPIHAAFIQGTTKGN